MLTWAGGEERRSPRHANSAGWCAWHCSFTMLVMYLLDRLGCRAAIHEAMEQQSTHVAKAGMMVSRQCGKATCPLSAHGLRQAC